MKLYGGLVVSICIWIVSAVYVFSRMKKTYNEGEPLSKKFLITWFVMWGFHHLPVIISSSCSLWQVALNRTAALAGGIVIIVAGVTILAKGMIEFRHLRRSTGQDISSLVSTGIYGWSRNPQFVGWFLILSGVSLMGRSGFAFILTAMFVIVMHFYTIRLEEPYLELLFGEEYRSYKSGSSRYSGIPKRKQDK